MYQTLYAQATVNLNPSVTHSNNVITKKMSGKEQDKYNTNKVTRQTDEVDFSGTIFESTVIVDKKQYLVIKRGDQIDKKYEKTFVLVKTGQAPNEWVPWFEQLFAHLS